MNTMARLREVGLRFSNSLEMYSITRFQMNPRRLRGFKALAASEIVSIISCCPTCSREIAYGSSVLMALCLEMIRSEWVHFDIASSF